MLPMAEEVGHETLMWDDPSWAFPVLLPKEACTKMVEDTGDAGGQKGVEVEAPPSAGGKERHGGGGDEGREGKGGGCGEFDHDPHIWTERERRKKMRNMFTDLHALIPHLPPRADKSTIVDEAVIHIRKLQLTLSKLEKQKKERLKCATANSTSCDPSTSITKHKLPIQSREAFLAEHGSTSNPPVSLANPSSTASSPLSSGPEFPAAIFKTWTSPNVVLNVSGKDAHISICCPKKPGLFTAVCFVMDKYKLDVVSAHVSSHHNRRLYMIHAQANGAADKFPEALFFVEEIYKQAAAEIILWLNC